MSLQAMDTVEVDGLTIAYQRAGAGPALVLLHGYVGDGLSTWRPQLEALCNEFTGVAWDAPGAGGSADPPESFGIADYAECLAVFITQLGLDRPHVAGLSFGAALAIAFAQRYPATPASLVLASAYAGWRGSLPPDVAEQRLQQALRLADASAREFTDTLLPTMFSTNPGRAAVEGFRNALLAFHPTGFRAMARASAEDLREGLSAIDIPTLLVYGDTDVRAPLTVAEQLRASLPTSSLVVLPGIGHVCNLEAAEEFNNIVRRFLLGAPA
jgi:pimeloyl-ACP methyl ester carboxylesterase